MARKVASMSFRPRRDVGSMRGARSSILESMKWNVQVRHVAITVRHHVHFNSDGLTTTTANNHGHSRGFSKHARRPYMIIGIELNDLASKKKNHGNHENPAASLRYGAMNSSCIASMATHDKEVCPGCGFLPTEADS